MNTNEKRTFVGFGLGAIQTGLFLYEAQSSGGFDRFVVAEVVPDTVLQVRESDGLITVNIAYPDRIEAARVGPVETLNPTAASDRLALEAAVAEAQEIATAVPGVNFYCGGGPEALCQILAAGLRKKARQDGPRAVIYAAENHNHAAEILQEQVLAQIPPREHDPVLQKVRFLNTVIGKMSGVISDPSESQALGLAPMTPGNRRAFLVEAFNRILITRIQFDPPGYQRQIASFIEKDDLLPFEEAKLYGHNATHALAAYLGALLKLPRIAGLKDYTAIMGFLRQAFIEESGAALIRRYGGIDPLFTPQGYADYADDLLERMVNPFLADTVERVGRDVERKLGWEDRLVGTMRLCLAEGIQPRRYAIGAAAALAQLDPGYLEDRQDPAERLTAVWGSRAADPQAAEVLALVRDALDRLRRWDPAVGKAP